MLSLQRSVDANGAAAALQGRTIAILGTLEWLGHHGAPSSEAELQDKQRALTRFEIMVHSTFGTKKESKRKHTAVNNSYIRLQRRRKHCCKSTDWGVVLGILNR